MCLMCVEIAKERMTVSEARRALPELIDTTKNDQERKHYQELHGASDENLKKIAKSVAASVGDAE